MPVLVVAKADDVRAEGQAGPVVAGQHQRAAQTEDLGTVIGTHVERLPVAGDGPGAGEMAFLRPVSATGRGRWRRRRRAGHKDQQEGHRQDPQAVARRAGLEGFGIGRPRNRHCYVQPSQARFHHAPAAPERKASEGLAGRLFDQRSASQDFAAQAWGLSDRR
jgi:hypothetical protein